MRIENKEKERKGKDQQVDWFKVWHSGSLKRTMKESNYSDHWSIIQETGKENIADIRLWFENRAILKGMATQNKDTLKSTGYNLSMKRRNDWFTSLEVSWK